MDTLLTLSVFNTLFAILLFSSSISTQPLYEDGDRSYNDFNAKSKEIALQTFQEKTEVRLKETEVQFEKCKQIEDFMSESYTILLKMINKGQFPHGSIFVQSLSFFSTVVETTYCFHVVLLLLFRTDFGNGFKENGKVFKIKIYLALLHFMLDSHS